MDEQFWSNKYESGSLGWDIGHESTPIKAYVDQLDHKDIQILIPGAGNAYEAEYLFNAGFQNVHVLDLSAYPLTNLKQRIPSFPSEQLHQKNFFDFEGAFDLIIEQTFFCALEPSLRATYVEKMNELLKPGGKLVGLLFNIPLNIDRPPFGGDLNTYKELFESYFDIRILETAYNSIPQRAGNELFFQFCKPISI